MAMFASTRVHEHTDKVEDVFHMRFAWITKVVNMVSIDVNAWWELKVIVDFSPAEVDQIKLEALEVED